MSGMSVEAGAQGARNRALAVLRIRSRALAVALLPAAVAVVLLAGGSAGHLPGPAWDTARWAMSVLALLVLFAAGGIALVVARARPAVSPTVPISEESAPDLYRMVRDLADRLDVPAPSAIALTPDCDSWLEDRTHPAHGPPPREDHDEIAGVRGPHRRAADAPVLVIGSPFLWWMRVGELRAVLAPVVAGTGPSAHPDIAAARRFVRGLDAAVAVTSAPGRNPVTRAVLGGIGWVARLLLRSCRVHAAEMERGVAAAAADRAQAVDYGLRIVAQEQVGLAYAGWDRLLTRVALPAWRMGRWPARLDAGVVAALTELSRRDRLAEGFASRLGERPACDLLEEPGAVDEAASLLAARLFHGGPAEPGPEWSPVDWQEYPDEVVDRKWRTDAARLHRVLDALGVRRAPDPTSPDPDGPTLARVLDHLTNPTPPPSPHRDTAPHATTGNSLPHEPDADDEVRSGVRVEGSGDEIRSGVGVEGSGDELGSGARTEGSGDEVRSGVRVEGQGDELPSGVGVEGSGDELGSGARTEGSGDEFPPGERPEGSGAELPSGDPPEDRSEAPPANEHPEGHPNTPQSPEHAGHPDDPPAPNERSAALAARLTAELAREEATAPGNTSPAGSPAPGQGSPDTALWDDGTLPLFPLQPPRTGRELLADHVTAMVCCAAVDTAGATPGLDWLDGPSLMVNGERAADLTPRVLSLVEDGDPAPLRTWLIESGIRPEKPVRLV